MDFDEFRKNAVIVADYIAKYFEKVKYYPVAPPAGKIFGLLYYNLPSEFPEQPAPIDTILQDFDNSVVPGILHWNHPHFFAYFGCGSSYTSILAEILVTGLGAVGFNWSSCPALSELEYHVMDMYGRLLNLPPYLLYEESSGQGGGFLNTSSSDIIHQVMLVARNRILKKMNCCPGKSKPTPDEKLKVIGATNKLVVYCSDTAHSSVNKSAYLLMTRIRVLETKPSEHDMLKPELLEKQMRKDIQDGLIPYCVVVSFGTSSTTAVDPIPEIAELLTNYPDVWLHVDATYGGCALILDKFKDLLSGISNIDSINVSPYKWSPVALDGSITWTKNRKLLMDTFKSKRKYMNYENSSDLDISSVSLSFERRFRCLRLWFTIRYYGKKRLRQNIENHMKLAQRFANYIRNDHMFRVVNTVNFSLVCFCVDGPQNTDTTEDVLTSELLERLNSSGKMYLASGRLKDDVFVRLGITYENSDEKLIDEVYKIIRNTAVEMVLERNVNLNARSSSGSFTYITNVETQ